MFQKIRILCTLFLATSVLQTASQAPGARLVITVFGRTRWHTPCPLAELCHAYSAQDDDIVKCQGCMRRLELAGSATAPQQLCTPDLVHRNMQPHCGICLHGCLLAAQTVFFMGHKHP